MSWRAGFDTKGLARLAALLVLVAAVLLLAPYFFVLAQTTYPLAAAVAGVAYFVRRRWWVALLFALIILAADWVEVQVGPQVMACFTLLFLAATNRPTFSLFVGAGVFSLLWVSIKLKHQFAGTLLTVQDIYYFFARFFDNVGVFASQPILIGYSLVALVLLLLPAIWLWRLDASRHEPLGRTTRSVYLLILLLIVGWSGHEVGQAAVKKRNRGPWLLSETIHGFSPLSGFLATAFIDPVATVPHADTEALRAQASRIGAEYRPAKLPKDIVVFLQESQFNPSTISGCPDSLCRLPIFTTNSATVAYGPMRVHVHGGATWLTEFSLASGLPHALFGAAADFAPFNVAPAMRRSFVRSLRDAGYRTVAVYPVRGGMMNARAAYAAYGFDRFYDSNDLGLSGDFFTSDQDIHAAALRVLEQERKSGQPVFLLALTIFNHSDHGIKMNRVPQALVEEAARYFPDEVTAQNLADYLWRSREFQRAMDTTTHTVLEPGGRPTVLAWFGDHQPPFARAKGLSGRIRPFKGAEQFSARYQTWYHVASNVNPGISLPVREPLDIVFLPGVLAQAAGAPLDDWLNANIAARVSCGGLLAECVAPGARDAYLSHMIYDLKSFDVVAKTPALPPAAGN